MSSNRARASVVAGIIVSAISVAGVTAAIFALRELMPVSAAGVLYLLAVLLASSYWGLAMGIGTSIASAAAFNFFHIPPTGRFTIADEENWVALGVFFVVAGVTSTLAGAARARAQEADQRRREADLSAEMARVLLGGERLEDSLRIVGQRIAQAFDLSWVEVETGWTHSDTRRRALPVVVAGERAGTVAVPHDVSAEVIESMEQRVVPSLETLLTAAKRAEPVKITAQRLGATLAIRVSDRGPGIPRAELERLFEPFHAAGERGGTGLGLAIARGFVEANGGTLRAQSLPGQGATFSIQLPVGASG